MSEPTDIDLTALTKEQVLTGVGDVLLGMLGVNRVALAVMDSNGTLTFLNPIVVKGIDPEALIQELVKTWTEEEIEKLLEHIYG